jgi:GT2 family glycosyltransferase
MTSTPQRQTTDVSVLIVTYNSSGQIRHCLDTLLSQTGTSLEIIVIDNNSTDATANVISNYSGRITAIANSTNMGFGSANNVGAAIARGRYLYLINPDAYMDGPNTLSALVEYADDHPEIGVLGTRVHDLSGTSETLPRRHYPRQKYSSFASGTLPGNIAWVIGASMLIPRPLYNSLFGFDEDFFMYGEEADLCLRTRQSGYAIGICERTSVTHIGGASEDVSQPYDRWYKRHLGLRQFCKKHYSPESFSVIIRRERRRALLGKTTYLLAHPFQHPAERMKGKFARYQAILDACNGRNRRPENSD